MKKLTDKTKYKIVDGSLHIYAKLKATGNFALLGTCHLSCLDLIQQAGTIFAENVVIRYKSYSSNTPEL